MAEVGAGLGGAAGCDTLRTCPQVYLSRVLSICSGRATDDFYTQDKSMKHTTYVHVCMCVYICIDLYRGRCTRANLLDYIYMSVCIRICVCASV